MIQRIQSLFLLVSSIIMVVFLTMPLARFFTTSHETLNLHVSGFKSIENSNDLLIATTPLLILSVVILALSVITIFMFRKRILQIRFCIYNILLNIGLIGLMIFHILNFMNNNEVLENHYTLSTPIPLVNIVLLVLAFRGIRKDEVLVKAYDRLR